MTWSRFWELGERQFERFYSASLTLIVLKLGDYVPAIPWKAVFVCQLIALIGSLAFGSLAIFASQQPSLD